MIGMASVRFALAAMLGVALGVSVSAQTPETGQGAEKTASAIFAGGCFWCMESPFDKLDGVISTTSGYIGGSTENPTYRQVTTGTTGHLEAVKVEYDPEKVSYNKLLDVFWRNIDPHDAGGQFCDRGEQYTTAIFYLTDDQKRLADASKQSLESGGKLNAPVVTPVKPAPKFYAAEDYHQDYYKKNPLKYRLYRSGCGRDARLEEVWGKAAS